MGDEGCYGKAHLTVEVGFVGYGYNKYLSSACNEIENERRIFAGLDVLCGGFCGRNFPPAGTHYCFESAPVCSTPLFDLHSRPLAFIPAQLLTTVEYERQGTKGKLQAKAAASSLKQPLTIHTS